MSEEEDQAFDKLMEMVGNDGKFQLVFNRVFNVGLVMCAAMAYTNIILAMTPPDHNCHVPGREKFNLSVEDWKNFTLPM
jgi:OCT family organic cation transporter-like MFS transporter 4/5